MTPDYLKNLCFECGDCYTLTFIESTDVLFINDKKNKKFYSWDSRCINKLGKFNLYYNSDEKKLIEEDIELLFSVGIKEFYKLFQQNKLKGIYK